MTGPLQARYGSPPVYLDPSHVIAQRESKPPLNYSRSGYGGKIGTRWELQLRDRKWRRVYVMQWSNSGTAYILVKGQRVLLGSYNPDYEYHERNAR